MSRGADLWNLGLTIGYVAQNPQREKMLTRNRLPPDIPNEGARTSPFEASLRVLFPTRDLDRKAILTLLENRCTWSAVRHWRAGRRIAPQWARDLIAAALAANAARTAHGLEQLARIPESRGYAPNIRAWHARKKEKGRTDAAPSSNDRGD